ncbi:MAG: T9SS type A sorting domain-containing protein, partial [Planctomycetes bacterium]|nr:T9SS type A sorting domain-containing protein [Planctomycetota bacterium]
AYWGSTTFTIEGIGLLDQTESDCQGARDDTSSIEIEVNEDTMTLTWFTPLLNCGLEPEWDGLLSADSFFVTMTNIGEDMDCVCPFTLTASFGPFQPGTYVLDFWDGYYGYPTFTIAGSGVRTYVISEYQSECFDPLGLDERENRSALKVTLAQNYPNPFNPSTTINWSQSSAQSMFLGVYNTNGQLIRTLVDEHYAAGEHSTTWDGTNEQGQSVSSGVYLYRLQTGDRVESRRMILMK